MKKLMIAAIAAATVGGAFAACSPTAPDPVKLAPWAYTWKFTGKTTDGVKVAGYTIPGQGNCTPGKTITVADEAIRVPASLNIQGYTYTCEPCCGGFAEFDKETFFITKPAKDAFVDDKGVVIQVANVIGKKAKEVEVGGMFRGETADSGERYYFTFAGLGKYDLKNIRVSSASGNFAGGMEAPHAKKVAGCPEAQIWDCTGTVYAGAPITVAYGKWSVKFNSSAAKKYANGVIVKAPSWMVGKVWNQQLKK